MGTCARSVFLRTDLLLGHLLSYNTFLNLLLPTVGSAPLVYASSTSLSPPYTLRGCSASLIISLVLFYTSLIAHAPLTTQSFLLVAATVALVGSACARPQASHQFQEIEVPRTPFRCYHVRTSVKRRRSFEYLTPPRSRFDL